MSLIIENGLIVPNANSYNSLLDAQAFVDLYGLNATLTDGLLLRAMAVFNGLNYGGYRVSAAQSLPFPRAGIVVDGFLLVNNEIPQRLKDAHLWLVYYISIGKDPAMAAAPQAIREKVDVLEVEYKPGTVKNTVSIYDLPNVINNIRPLLSSISRIDRA